MFERASKKLGLDHAVLARVDGDEDVSLAFKPKAMEIDALLRNGAYGIFKDEEDDESRKFREADIEKILESNTQTVVHAVHDGSGGNSTFSKASFTSELSRPELDVRVCSRYFFDIFIFSPLFIIISLRLKLINIRTLTFG